MLNLTDIDYDYGGRVALRGVTLSVGRGVTGLVGINGAGKTTLLSIAAGAMKPKQGAVMLKDRNLYSGADRLRVLPRIALVPQRFAYPAGFKVREFVTYLGYLRGMTWRAAQAATGEVLDAVNLGERSETRMASLSGGMLRRVGIAQALVTKPDVLLLDEPTTGLDPEQRVGVRDLIRQHAATRVVVLSSHLMEDVERLAANVVVLHDGQVRFDGSLDALVAAADRDGDADEQTSEAAFLKLVARRDGTV